jgi:hypothetical protein
MRVMNATWRCGADVVGAVAVERVDGWKAYIGVGAGSDEDADASAIAAHGAPLLEPEARAFFPQYADRPYAA